MLIIVQINMAVAYHCINVMHNHLHGLPCKLAYLLKPIQSQPCILLRPIRSHSYV